MIKWGINNGLILLGNANQRASNLFKKIKLYQTSLSMYNKLSAGFTYCHLFL